MSRLYSEQLISKDLTNKFIYIPNTTAIPEHKHRTKSSTFTVIFLGRGSPEKRVHLIGKIATRVKNIHSDIRFLMIGDVIDAVRPEDRSACTFTGPIKSPREISNLLQLSHIILLTSAREGVPLAVMEGMAHGLIPISTAVGDLPLLIQNNKNGWLLPHDNPWDIVDNATAYICTAYLNTVLQQEMSQCAYETARRILVNDSFAEAYREVLSAPVKINHESG
jgi:glycosyltransferase involved in cell wall biosynthesis